MPAAMGSKIEMAGEEKTTSGRVSEGMYDIVSARGRRLKDRR